MDTALLDRAITDHAAGLLLRYFSAAGPAHLDRPALVIARDRELLRLHWSLSSSVADLVTYVIEHRHEIQSVLSSAIRIEDGIVRGRLDAVATLRRRRMSGLSTAVVSHEPLRTYDSGPNQVLGWVLSKAWSLAARFSRITLDSPAYRASIDRSIARLEQVRRIQAISQIAGQSELSRRPSSHAVLEAGRSRRTLYRMATDAYRTLQKIEAGNPDSITAMLRQTLLVPLEPWRRYELAVAYGVADLLAQMQGLPLVLNFVAGDVRRPVARAGRFSVFWQWRTAHYRSPPQEPSEQVAQGILDVYGFSAASDRPDLIVVDHDEDAVAAIIEVKYLTGEDASDRIRSAVSQIVQYVRGYGPIAAASPLLGRSLVAVSQGLDGLVQPEPLPDGIPSVLDFAGVKGPALRAWARRLLEPAAS